MTKYFIKQGYNEIYFEILSSSAKIGFNFLNILSSKNTNISRRSSITKHCVTIPLPNNILSTKILLTFNEIKL